MAQIDTKQRDNMIQAILKDYPDLQKDSLQLHYIEQMVESYLLNPDNFKRLTKEVKKKEAKRGQSISKIPTEIFSISKIESPVDEQCESKNEQCESEPEGITNVKVDDAEQIVSP